MARVGTKASNVRSVIDTSSADVTRIRFARPGARMIFLAAGAGVVAANFLWQAIGAENWSLALDRSWFQVCALGAAWLTSLLSSPHGQSSGDQA
jgi:hypothetical protein